jgi:molecular chaperone Hsp33
MKDRDTLHRFLFERFPVRGKLVHLDASWQAVLERHDYPPVVRAVLGEAMAATAMLAATLKFDGKLTLQLQGPGPLNLLLVQCTSELALRGLARWVGDVPAASLAEVTGGGRLSVTIEMADERRYQGIVPLEGARIAECLQTYFAQSEQMRTRLWLTADDRRAVGMMLQKLPAELGGEEGDSDGWPRVRMLAETLTDEELLRLEDETLLRRLFHEEDVRLFAGLPVSFRCSCDRGRVESVLKMLGRDEVVGIVEEKGSVEVRCEFCNKPYSLDAVDIERLFRDGEAGGGSRTLH